ncbi:MAG: CvpA family protein [Clostridiales Family XIII bacterium]|nr:CvpA family protein [Clostridiales Family XIII bacterium]
MDVLIGLIVVLSMGLGYRDGFVFTLLRAIGWVVSFAAALFLHPDLTQFIKERTSVYKNMYETLLSRFSEKTADIVTNNDMPEAISKGMEWAVNGLQLTISESLSTVSINIISFILLILAVKTVFFLITAIFSKRSSHGVMKGMDGFLGLIAGGVKGLALVCVVFAFMMPLSLLISPALNEFLSNTLFSSTFAGDIYNHNPILLVWDSLASTWIGK